MAPLLVFALLLLSPYPSLLKQRRNDTATQAPSSGYRAAINIVNAFCCFTLVVVYLYDSALPQYTTPKWEAGVVFAENLMLPAFAYLLDAEQFQPVDFPRYSPPCWYANQSGWSLECPNSAMGKTPTRLYLNDYLEKDAVDTRWDYLAYIFNSSELPLLGSVVVNQVFLRIWPDYANDTIVEAVLFDPRINLTDAIGYGLMQRIEIPSPATNLIYVTAESTLDTLGMIHAPQFPARCAAFYKDSLSQPGLPYMSFGFSISTTDVVANISTSNLCRSDICSAEIELAYASHIVHTMESKPGINQLTIWLNCAAIVGAVQFFA